MSKIEHKSKIKRRSWLYRFLSTRLRVRFFSKLGKWIKKKKILKALEEYVNVTLYTYSISIVSEASHCPIDLTYNVSTDWLKKKKKECFSTSYFHGLNSCNQLLAWFLHLILMKHLQLSKRVQSRTIHFCSSFPFSSRVSNWRIGVNVLHNCWSEIFQEWFSFLFCNSIH